MFIKPIQLQRILYGIIWKLSSPVEQIKVLRDAQDTFAWAELGMVSSLYVVELGLVHGEDEGVLLDHAVCYLLVSQSFVLLG